MQGLHQQGSNSTDEGRQRTVHRPGGRAGAEVAGVYAVGELFHPIGCSLRIAGHDAAKALGDTRAREIDRIRNRGHDSRVPRRCRSRTLTGAWIHRSTHGAAPRLEEESSLGAVSNADPSVAYSAALSVTITSCVRPSRRMVSSTESPGALDRIDTISSVDSPITSPSIAVMTSPS